MAWPQAGLVPSKTYDQVCQVPVATCAACSQRSQTCFRCFKQTSTQMHTRSHCKHTYKRAHTQPRGGSLIRSRFAVREWFGSIDGEIRVSQMIWTYICLWASKRRVMHWLTPINTPSHPTHWVHRNVWEGAIWGPNCVWFWHAPRVWVPWLNSFEVIIKMLPYLEAIQST